MSQFSTPVYVGPASRMKDTKIVFRRSTGTQEFALWNADRTFSNAQDYGVHQVTDFEVGRLDLISHQHYNTVEYWWIIADANDLLDPLEEMRPGMILKIPNRSAIETYVRRRASR